MRRLGDSSPFSSWTVSTGFDMRADFCVWILERDGLRVPPFDQHADGTGELRTSGMTAVGWERWFKAVARAPAPIVTPRGLEGGDLRPYNYYPDTPPNPGGQTSGDAETVRRHLDVLWKRYGPISNQRRNIEPDTRLPNWEQYLNPNPYYVLQPYHARIQPPFVVRLVQYVDRVDVPAPPSHVVLGLTEPPSPDAYRAWLLAAATALAEAA